jgi:hypothetical protein
MSIFVTAVEALRDSMHGIVDKLIDQILVDNKFPSDVDFAKMVVDARKDLTNRLEDLFVPSIQELYTELILDNRSDIVALMHQAEQGRLVGKRVIVKQNNTKSSRITAIIKFLRDHNVITEVV